jgi:hypothetical protein
MWCCKARFEGYSCTLKVGTLQNYSNDDPDSLFLEPICAFNLRLDAAFQLTRFVDLRSQPID